MAHGARDVVGELAIVGAVEIGFYLSVCGHGRFSFEVEGIGRIPQLGTGYETQVGPAGSIYRLAHGYAG
jgi:hypothetical protein